MFLDKIKVFFLIALALLVAGCATIETVGHGHLTDAQKGLLRDIRRLSSQEAYDYALKLWGQGRQPDAEFLLGALTRKHAADQRLLFFQAVCIRSRFQYEEAWEHFAHVFTLNATTPEGLCSKLAVGLDLRDSVEEDFEQLRELVRRHPDDVLLLWMLAIECREHDRNEEGVQHFRALLRKVEVGSGLVHQTFGNVLRESGSIEEAHAHYAKAAELDPTGWSYNGLAISYADLGRYEESEQTFRKGSELAPNYEPIWDSWAWMLEKCGRDEEALQKYQRAMEIEPDDYEALTDMGKTLARLGRYDEALDCIRLAASNGYAGAATQLGRMYHNGQGVAQDYSQAMQLYLQAASAGDDLAMHNIGVLYEYGLGVPANGALALEWFGKAAKKGRASSMAEIGFMYLNGFGVPIDFTDSLAWSKRAAAYGNAQGVYNVGLHYRYGRGVETDLALALSCFQQAASNNYPMAFNAIGCMYELGEGLLRDGRLAFEFYQRAALGDVAMGMYNLGRSFQHGIGTRQDFATAVQWYERAAAAGEPLGMSALAESYARGRGVQKDETQAASWFERAAALGNVHSMRRLGFLCEQGVLGSNRVHDKVNFWQKASAAGDGESQNALAWHYATCPEESVRDADIALKYAALAVSQQPSNGAWQDTLAAAYACKGDFTQAVAAQENAIRLLSIQNDSTNEMEDFVHRLEQYKRGEPYVAPSQTK